jgi:glycerol-3-phosphate acyltransferase PlsY
MYDAIEFKFFSFSPMNIVAIVILFLIAYLLGSVPTGYLAGKLLQGIDIREHGSGSTGATNVLRTLGNVPGTIVLLIDAVKGVLAVSIVHPLVVAELVPNLPKDWEPYLIALTAAGAIIGHSKSIWLNFSGGKSVATGVGVLLAMCWPVGLATIGVFALSIAITRIVSISSIAGAIAVTIWMVVFQQPLPYIIFALVGGIYVIVRHQGNIQRLMAGTEPKLGENVISS